MIDDQIKVTQPGSELHLRVFVPFSSWSEQQQLKINFKTEFQKPLPNWPKLISRYGSWLEIKKVLSPKRRGSSGQPLPSGYCSCFKCFLSSSETAENIGYSCSLLTDDMHIHYGEDVKWVDECNLHQQLMALQHLTTPINRSSARPSEMTHINVYVTPSFASSLPPSFYISSEKLRIRQTRRRIEPQAIHVGKKRPTEPFFNETGKNALIITGGWLVTSKWTPWVTSG